MSHFISGPYPTLVLLSADLMDGRTFLLASPVVLLVLMLREQNVRTAPLATALRIMPTALIMASLLTIGAYGILLVASAIFDRAPLAYLDAFILGPILLAPHLFCGAVLLPLVRFCLRQFGAGPAIVGVASVPVVLLAVFQHSLIPNFS